MTTRTRLRLAASLNVLRIGYGAMRIVGQPGNWGDPPDRKAVLAVLRDAVSLGVNLIDTADIYGPGISEELIAEALSPYPTGVVLATKGGMIKRGPNPGQTVSDGRPEHLRAACEASLRRLRVDCIDLYQLHRPDPAVELADSLCALDRLREAGKIRHIGLSNVTRAQVEAARDVVPIAAVQNRYNLVEYDPEREALIDYCAREGIAFLPWGPLAADPRVVGAGVAAGPVATVLEAVAAVHGASTVQVAIAWLLHRSPTLLPIPGSTSRTHLAANVAAAALILSDDELAELSRARTALTPARKLP